MSAHRTSRLPLHTLSATLVATLALAGRADAQLQYERTTFLHGLGSDSVIWAMPYPALGSRTPPQYLSSQVYLKTVGAPRLNAGAPDRFGRDYVGQRANLSQFVTSTGGRHVLVGHSQGALVARGAYEALGGGASPVTGILAIAAPHQGALLADSAMHAFQYLENLEKAANAAGSRARIGGAIITAIGMLLVPSAALAGYATIGFGITIVHRSGGPIQFPTAGLEDLPKLRSLPALRPQSPTIQHLRSYVGDGGIARANIRGSIPHEDALLRLAAAMGGSSFEALRAEKRKGLSSLRTCRDLAFFTFGIGASDSRCQRAQRMLAGLDARWAGWANGTQYGVVGRTSLGHPIYGQVPRLVPFDGVVPNANSAYPTANGIAYDYTVDGANHMDIYQRQDGLNNVAQGMRLMNMLSATPLAASISGPTSFDSWQTLTWSAVAQGGNGTYAYQWSYRPENASQWYPMGTIGTAAFGVDPSTPSFSVRVTVSSAGQSVTTMTHVTNTAAPCVPPPGQSVCYDH